jgi:hypothetical protein
VARSADTVKDGLHAALGAAAASEEGGSHRYTMNTPKQKQPETCPICGREIGTYHSRKALVYVVLATVGAMAILAVIAEWLGLLTFK